MRNEIPRVLQRLIHRFFDFPDKRCLRALKTGLLQLTDLNLSDNQQLP